MSKKQQTAVAETREYKLDWAKWLVVLAILIGVAVGNSIYSEQSLLLRVSAGLVLALLACVVAVQTKSGAEFWHIAKGSRSEIRKVVWPNAQERNRSTLVVVIFVFISALVLAALDWVFGQIGSWLLG